MAFWDSKSKRLAQHIRKIHRLDAEIQQLIGTSYLAALEDPEMLREIQQMAQGQSAFENVLEVNDIENQNPWLGNPSW